MKTSLKIFGLLFSFLVFLSITIHEKPIFSYVYDVISPATITSQNLAEKLLNKTVVLTQRYSKKIFDNSVPRIKDSVGSSLSANLKIPANTNEDILSEDSAHLDDLIKNHK